MREEIDTIAPTHIHHRYIDLQDIFLASDLK